MSTAEKVIRLKSQVSKVELSDATVSVLGALGVKTIHAMKTTPSGKTLFKGLHDLRIRNERFGSIREYEDGSFIFIPVQRYYPVKMINFNFTQLSLKEVAQITENIKKWYF